MDEPEIQREAAARLWATAQALARRADSVRGGAPSRVPPLLFFTDPDRTPRPWETAARMPAGSGVVYRAFAAADALETARRLRLVTIARGITLLIGRDPALAEAVGADGLHLPERALSAAYALSGRHPDWILTGAVHSVAAARGTIGLDAVVLSPIFPAGGASAGKAALGVDAVDQASRQCRVIALGGITPDNAADLVGNGASGLAGVAAIQDAFAA
ncbi:thiamine phosphate synthase [Brevundimonas sp. LM2]|uniref:thiamine phosphate synthase n=1 Tax=Brevundimonas sp. LM2 TaxID=1938605 RepID=UPI000983E3AA|nr:thiamine phosphate synthase [Brevundimonas sp. LM2]AQR63288.1 thiamine phosphate synthase [Brevundimonas sp. LM2]